MMAGTTAPRKRAAKPKAKTGIEAILDEVETPEGSVTLCLKGSLVAEFERLEAELNTVTVNPLNLAGDSPGRGIADRLEELRAQMVAHMHVFNFRAVTPRRDWLRLQGKKPVKTPDIDAGELADRIHTWLCQVVAASAVDPAMTVEQAGRLADKLSNGQWTLLAGKALDLNDDAQTIPFSVAASVLTRSSGEKSKQPEPSDNPDHGSLAGSPASEPSSNGTPTTGESPAG